MSKKSGEKRSAMKRLSETMDTILSNVDTKKKKGSPTTKNKACKKLKLTPNPALSFLRFKPEESISDTSYSSFDKEQPSVKQRSVPRKWIPPIVKKHDSSFENIENTKKWRNNSIDKEKSEFENIEHLKVNLYSMKNNQMSPTSSTQFVERSQLHESYDNGILYQVSPNKTNKFKGTQVTTMNFCSKSQEIEFHDTQCEISSTLNETSEHPRSTKTNNGLFTNSKEPQLDLPNISISLIDKNTRICLNDSSDDELNSQENNSKCDVENNNSLYLITEENTGINNNIHQIDKLDCNSFNDHLNNTEKTCDEMNPVTDNDTSKVGVYEMSNLNTSLNTNNVVKIDLSLDEDKQITEKEVLVDMIHEKSFEVEDEIEDNVFLTCKAESDLSANNTTIEDSELEEIFEELNTIQETTILRSTKELSTDDESNTNNKCSLSQQLSEINIPKVNSQHLDDLHAQTDIDKNMAVEPNVNNIKNSPPISDEATWNNPSNHSSQNGTLETNSQIDEDNIQLLKMEVTNSIVDEKDTDNENERKNMEDYHVKVESLSNDGNKKCEEIDKKVYNENEGVSNILKDINIQSDITVGFSVSKTQNGNETNATLGLSNEVSNTEKIGTTCTEIKDDDSSQKATKLNYDTNENPIVVIEGNDQSTVIQSSDEDIAKQKIYKDLIECSDDFYNLPMSQLITIENEYKENITVNDRHEISSNSETESIDKSRIVDKNQTATCRLVAEVNKALPPVPRFDWLRRTQDEKQKLRSIVQEINALNSIIEQCRKEIWPQFSSNKK